MGVSWWARGRRSRASSSLSGPQGFKLAALHARLRDKQSPLLEKHGVTTEGVFTSAGENLEALTYVLVSAEGPGAMNEGWKDFVADPEWQKFLAESEQDGPLVAQASKTRLRTTRWSPVFSPEKSTRPRVFELRTYTGPDRAKHSALMKRFREHTMRLFENHGMTNLVYWTPDEGPAASQKLVYLLAHDSVDAAQNSFAAFRADPDWLAARKASEEQAGGSLTNAGKGVVSEFLVATEYSPLKQPERVESSMRGLKVLILCKSVHHGNTVQVARAMAGVLGAEVADPEEVPYTALGEYGLLGFGSGVYYGRMHQTLSDWLRGLPDTREAITPAFVFSTSGLPFLRRFWHQPLKTLLVRKGFEVVGDFACRGFDTWGPLWLTGGLNREHPDARDLTRAVEFARKLVPIIQPRRFQRAS